jgi:hypothetical protein
MMIPGRAWIRLLLLALTITTQAQAAERVVIIVLDGLRASEGFDDPEHRFIPRMALDLAPQGALARACDNDGLTITIPGHAAIGSGRYQNLPDDGTVRSIFPLLWEYYRDQTSAPGRSTVIPTTKGKIKSLSHSSWSTYGAPDSARIIGPTWDDEVTTAEFLHDMAVNRPVVSLLNFGSIDGAAHTQNWDGYTRQIAVADSCVALIWQEIQADPVFRGRTDLIVTGDHGRHADGYGAWHEHGDGCPGCRRIPLLALGPDFRDGFVSWTPCEQVDICKTLGAALGVAVPYAGGRVMTELLEPPPAGTGDDPVGPASIRVAVDGSRARFFTSGREQVLTLEIHDVTGRRLAGGACAPGASWTWDGPATGIYFYHAGRESGRFVILR